jgi:two-component system, cell cycle sensor histidine kinase and response regulator CckA
VNVNQGGIAAADMLKESLLFKLLIDRAENPLLLSTIEGRYLYVNDCYLRLRGLDKDAIVGSLWWKTFTTLPERQFIRELYDLIVKNRAHSYNFEYPLPDERRVTISWMSQIIEDPASGGQFIAEIGKDITEEIKLQMQLIQAQKMESLGTLAGGIAHDFNNILTSIIGYATFLKGRLPMESDERKYAQNIFKSALRATELTSKLLGFARKGKYSERLININNVVHEVYEIIKSTFNKNIRINLRLQDPLALVLADYDQLYQSLMNLVINSRDAMPAGGTLTIRTGEVFFPENQEVGSFTVLKGRYVSLTVEDTGCGMDDDVRLKAFDPFFTTKEAGKGTGLGLAMVYGIVKNHHGYIFLDSKKNRGTQVVMHLPMVADVPSRPDGENALESTEYHLFNLAGPTRILIVEDEEDILDYLDSILSDAGCIIHRARNGQEGVDLYREHSADIDLVIMDMIMPVMDGCEAIEHLKQINPDLKVIVATGYSKGEVIEHTRSLGISHFIFKPFKVADLLILIREVMQGGVVNR